MPLLNVSEYDISYFDGDLSSLKHNAGYSYYQKWFNNGSNNFAQRASSILNRYAVGNKKVLEICCAKGFLVEELVNLGIDAYGIDVSSYAIGEADPSIASRLTIADIRTHLSTYRNNEFALVISANSLCCFSDLELINIIDELNRISRDQFHIVTPQSPIQFYNPKTISEWIALDWQKGTIIADIRENFEIK